jgi:hypothetical protein
MKIKMLLTCLLGFVGLVGCAAPATQTSPLATITPTLFISTPTSLLTPGVPGGVTPAPGGTAAPNPSTICNNDQVSTLIESFRTAVLNSDGSQLSSLVSPARGMDVARFRDGTVITYKPEHARFLFETTFEVDWGPAPGSGEATRGPFHEIILPELIKVLNQPYTLHCNELMHGGATYELDWPYQGEFYSIYFPGTQANGNMDWYTWAMGIEYVSGKPYIYALIPFFWEP